MLQAEEMLRIEPSSIIDRYKKVTGFNGTKMAKLIKVTPQHISYLATNSGALSLEQLSTLINYKSLRPEQVIYILCGNPGVEKYKTDLIRTVLECLGLEAKTAEELIELRTRKE